MQITNVNIKDIKPYENNPRFNDNAVDYVANSIKEFGFKVPVVLDKNNVIITGHTRVKACKKLGIEEIPCIYADDLTEEQVKAFRLVDNKTGEFAEWDFDLLDDELGEIDLIDMNDLGFDNLNISDEEIEREMEYLTQERKKKFYVRLEFDTEEEAKNCKQELLDMGYPVGGGYKLIESIFSRYVRLYLPKPRRYL